MHQAIRLQKSAKTPQTQIQSGNRSLEDFEMINKRLVSNQNAMPENIRVACHTNKQREAINVATWVTHLDEHGSNQGSVALADELKVRRESHRACPSHPIDK